MPTFHICFRVEQTLSGSFEIEAESAEAARNAWDHAMDNIDPADPLAKQIDDLRLEAKLELEDSQDSLVEITASEDQL